MTNKSLDRTFEELLRIGAFYTPKTLTNVICRWAIRSAKDRIFEPSFGGCRLLASSKERLKELGARWPNQVLFGCDVDDIAFKYLSSVIGLTNIKRRFLKQDFLECDPQQFSVATFQVIVANPPFVSRHRMTWQQRKKVDKFIGPSGCEIDRTAALWVYFLLHSLKFLADNGRMVWILPASFMFADYARAIRQFLEKRFAAIDVIALPRTMFKSENVSEPTVAAFFKGYQSTSNKPLWFGGVQCVNEISELLAMRTARKEERWLCLNKETLESELLPIKNRLCDRAVCKKLGELFYIEIGLVTGDNEFFVITENTAKSRALSKNVLVPIVASSKMLRGLTVTKEDLVSLRESGSRCLLLNVTPQYSRGKRVKAYLESYSKVALRKNVTFKKRRHWSAPLDQGKADAFLTCMFHYAPRVAFNVAEVNCTNTLYRLKEIGHLSERSKKLIAISVVSSVTAYSAELQGKRHKSGSLKLEPTAARELRVVIPKFSSRKKIDQHYSTVDTFLRSGLSEEARFAADRALVDLIGVPKLKDELDRVDLLLRKRRAARTGCK